MDDNWGYSYGPFHNTWDPEAPSAAGEDLQDLLAKAAEVQSLRSEKASGRWLMSKKNMRGFNHVQASTDISGYNMIHQSSTDKSGYDTVNDGCFFSWELGGFFSVKP